MNFNCIFAATHRNTFSAKMRLVERMLRVASEFLSEESTFLYRVAAVYFFYAVYNKQLSATKVKIRMTPTMWKDLMDFLNIVIEHRHLDVAYVIQTLRKQNAFAFVAFPKYLLFGRHEFMLGSEGMMSLRQTYDSDKYISGLFESDIVERTESLQEEYDEVKAKVLGESKEEEVTNLTKILFHSNSDFPIDFKKILDGHRKVHERGSMLKPDVLDSTQRPILSQLQELYHGLPQKGKTVSPKKVKAKSKQGKMKEKAWNSKVAFSSPGKRAGPKKNLADIESDPEEPEEERTIVYKRSAMLQERKVKKTRTKNAAGIRYRVAATSPP